MWIFRQIIMFIRFALPHALGLILSALWGSLRLVGRAVISVLRELWPTVVEIAEHWVEEAEAHGFPSIWERHLRITFRILATITIFTGWLIILVSGFFAANYAYNALFY